MVGVDVNVYDILNGDTEHFSAFMQNWPDGREEFASEFFDTLLRDSNLHPQLQGTVSVFRPHFIASACASDAVYCDPANPLRLFLGNVLRKGQTWYPVPGRAGQEFPEQISKLWQQCSDKPESLLATLLEYIEKDTRRAEISEQRLCESEEGAIKQADVHRQVLALLNQHLSGSLIPAEIGHFLQNQWRAELLFLRFNAKEFERDWQHWSLVIEAVGYVFSEKSQTSQSKRMQRIQDLFLLLEKPVSLNVCDKEAYAEFVSDLNAALFKRLKGRFDTDEVLQAIPLPNDSGDGGATLSKAMAGRSRGLKPGDWFLFTGEDERIMRCKLALKPEGTDQLLFVNAHGRKVMQKDVETFLLCLSTLVAKPLSLGPQFEFSLTRLINQRRALLEKAQDELRASNRGEQVADSNEVEWEADGGQFNGAVGTLVHSLVGNPEDVVAKPGEEVGKWDEETIELAEESVASLRVGAWLELIDGAGNGTRCKLAVIIKGSNKYIFTDRLGAKVAEVGRERLLSWFGNNQIVIHGVGENFEDQLAKVIRGLRKT